MAWFVIFRNKLCPTVIKTTVLSASYTPSNVNLYRPSNDPSQCLRALASSEVRVGVR